MSWLSALVLGLLAALSLAQPITIGVTCAMNQELGRLSAAGLAFALEEANRAGGVMSRNLSLIVMDDGYNTTTALANIRTLLASNVLLLAAVSSSDTALQSKPLILQQGVPFVGAVTGTPDLRTPFHREFVNVRASYGDEMVMQALFLVQHARVHRIACMYQNDSFGLRGLAALVAALANVGIQLVATGTYTRGTANVGAAVEAIASATEKAQAVVLVAAQEAVVQFIPLFHNDSRTDPQCTFTVTSPGWGTSVVSQVPTSLWSQIYFFFVVPLPGDPKWAIARNFASAYAAAGNVPNPMALEGYITGRFIVDVLKRTRSANPTRAMFLDEVYNDRLFVLDDLVVGMYSDNYTGCSQALCSCNSGLRTVYTAQLNPTTKRLGWSLYSLQYSVLECSSPISNVIAPLLFGQLLPSDGWRAMALEMGRGIAQAFAEANAGGGAGGREFVLLQQNYSSNVNQSTHNMTNRYPLVALLGGVVPDAAEVDASVPSIGTFETKVAASNDAFSRNEVRVQPATSLELMAMASWATQQCTAVHLRAPATPTGQQLLIMMTKSVESFQKRATSTSTFINSSDMLSSTQTGCVIAVGSNEDVQGWFTSLPTYPNLHLLTLSGPVMSLMALSPNADNLSHASRLHFPTIITDMWNTTIPSFDPSEPWKYGYVLGQAVMSALTHSEYSTKSYTTPAELLSAWYTVKVMTSGAVTLGPYDGDSCLAGQTECECNEGARSLAIRSVASSDVDNLYSISTCHVVYTPLQESDDGDTTMAAIVGAVVGFCGFVAICAVLYLLRTRRNHSAAPKDPHKPFCILFTDIQASTHLWATIPDVMAPALSTHHALIRQVIAKHRCYEVKTIGDSFMCAVRSPQQAMRLALAIQTALQDHDWGTDAIDRTYLELLETNEVSRVSRSCWNGLRVRVGIHYGLGDIQFDPVSKSYDYYGTVVNTAARIENVCHGGQIGVSQEVYDEVKDSISDVVWSDLGCQPLRGLAEGICMFQALPAGPLACRTFPALRLDKLISIQVAENVDLEVAVASHHSSVIASNTKSNSIAPSTSNVSTVEDWRWVETHPLVLRGDVGTEELKQLYTIALSTLSTLLTTQTEKFRQHTVQGLCDRLHVTNCGVQGLTLQRTLRGLVHRILPATVVKAHQLLQKCPTRQNSKLTLSTSPLQPPDVTSVGY